MASRVEGSSPGRLQMGPGKMRCSLQPRFYIPEVDARVQGLAQKTPHQFGVSYISADQATHLHP